MYLKFKIHLKECLGGYAMTSDKRDCSPNKEIEKLARSCYEVSSNFVLFFKQISI